MMRKSILTMGAAMSGLLLAGPQPAVAACHERFHFNIYLSNPNTLEVKTLSCEKCFGDIVQNDPNLPNFCPGSGNIYFGEDICPGVCFVNSSISCLDDSDCPEGDSCVEIGDGVVSQCYGSNYTTINGTSTADSIYGGSGHNVINGNGGDDEINGGPGNDTINGGDGADTLTGGDLAVSGGDISGDDRIFGDNSGDVIFGNGGRDYLDGGPGNDIIGTTQWGWLGGRPAPDDAVGALICGGTGQDTIWATGPRHQCIDGGSGQSNPGFGLADCVYQFAVLGRSTADGVSDIGTVRNCAVSSKSGAQGLFESGSAASCGCSPP